MTFEEAKKQLEELIQFIYGDDNKTYGMSVEALKTAISALNKQIPKKPVEKSPWVYHCPNCDSQNIEEVFVFIERFKFCRDCGQALDWSETDD